MSLGDFPKVPAKYKPRIQKLFNKVKTNETTIEQVLTDVLAASGTFTLDAKGCRMSGEYGSFEADTRFWDDIEQSLICLIDAVPTLLRKKQFLIKTGQDLKKVTMGYMGFWVTKGKQLDIKNKKLPIVEIVSSPVESMKKSLINMVNVYLQRPLDEWVDVPAYMKIHRMEQFGEWMGNDWKTPATLLKAVVPITDLSTKEVLDKLNETTDPYCDHVLKKCGV